MKSKSVLLIVIILSNLCVTGCWNSREINTLAIATAIGIDEDISGGVIVTAQILNPRAIAAKIQTYTPPVMVYKEHGKDVFEAIQRLTLEVPRLIYLSHLRVVVFGEKFVKNNGISDVLDFLSRNHEVRTDFYFVVAKNSTANTVLETLTRIESVPASKIYNELETSETFFAPTKAIKLIELVNSIVAEGKSPVLSGLEVTGGQIIDDNITATGKTTANNQLKLTNLAILKKDKLVGWLNEDESKGYNYITENVKFTVGYLPYNESGLSFYVTKVKSKQKARLVNGKPVIDIELDVKEDVGSVDCQIDVTKEENLKKLEAAIDKKQVELCTKSVKKAQELDADIFGFGELIHRTYPKQWEKMKVHWDTEFKNLPFNITAKNKIIGLGAISKSFFYKEKE